MEAHLKAFVALLRDVLGRRLLKVYWIGEGEDEVMAEANLVVLVEDRDWTEDYIIHQEGARLMRETGEYMVPLVVTRKKWEHWRRLGKALVTRVEEEGVALYDRGNDG